MFFECKIDNVKVFNNGTYKLKVENIFGSHQPIDFIVVARIPKPTDDYNILPIKDEKVSNINKRKLPSINLIPKRIKSNPTINTRTTVHVISDSDSDNDDSNSGAESINGPSNLSKVNDDLGSKFNSIENDTNSDTESINDPFNLFEVDDELGLLDTTT